MARILILANNDVGLYKFRKELLEQLVKENDVFVSLPNGLYIPDIVDIGCKFIDTSISRRGTNPHSDLKLLLQYRKIIKEIMPDVVLTFTIKPNVYGGIAARLNNTPYIANITGLGTAVENKGMLQKITLILYKIALKSANCVFFQNQDNKQFFIDKKILKSPCRLLPGSGVNLEEYSLLDYPENEQINFLFIARVMKEKGIDEYLEAAESIKEKYPKTAFHILGYCEQDYEEILKEKQNKGIIKYHGMQTDVRRFHKISHCTIHPTYYPEGMSNVLLESSACGRPIITTDRAGCRELVDDGINGFVMKQQNSQDLIEKIEKFLRLTYEDKKKMGLCGREKITKDFNREIVIGTYFEELEKIDT